MTGRNTAQAIPSGTIRPVKATPWREEQTAPRLNLAGMLMVKLANPGKTFLHPIDFPPEWENALYALFEASVYSWKYACHRLGLKCPEDLPPVPDCRILAYEGWEDWTRFRTWALDAANHMEEHGG